ncbi:MAG: hypothetical protein L0G99_04760 [Propionibacteriales bacterium]|nr:hypothetical protein [Propionibacteriales bacterium]
MKKSRTIIASGAATLMLLLGAAQASAGDWSNYNTTVGRFNGNGYTGDQAKGVTDATGWLRSGTVGGDYKVDARMESISGTFTSGFARIGDGTNVDLPNDFTEGTRVRVRFSNDLTTRVNVQVSGSWNPR